MALAIETGTVPSTATAAPPFVVREGADPLPQPAPRALTGGYVRQPMRVVRHEMEPGTLKCTVTLFDMGALYASGFILGPDTVSSPWLDAHNIDQERYGYLSNDAGVYGDGTPGKVLR